MIPTPLLELEKNLLVKMEIDNPSGSHKIRAAKFIIESAIKKGQMDTSKNLWSICR